MGACLGELHLVIHTGFAFFIVLLSDFCRKANWGLVYWFRANVLWTVVLSFLVLDFFIVFVRIMTVEAITDLRTVQITKGPEQPVPY